MNYLLKWNQIKWTKVAPFETDAIIYIILFIILSYIINIFNSVSRYVKPKPILYSHTKMVPGGTFWETYVKPKPFEWSQNPYFIPYTKMIPGGTFWETYVKPKPFVLYFIPYKNWTRQNLSILRVEHFLFPVWCWVNTGYYVMVGKSSYVITHLSRCLQQGWMGKKEHSRCPKHQDLQELKSHARELNAL